MNNSDLNAKSSFSAIEFIKGLNWRRKKRRHSFHIYVRKRSDLSIWMENGYELNEPLI